MKIFLDVGIRMERTKRLEACFPPTFLKKNRLSWSKRKKGFLRESACLLYFIIVASFMTTEKKTFVYSLGVFHFNTWLILWLSTYDDSQRNVLFINQVMQKKECSIFFNY